MLSNKWLFASAIALGYGMAASVQAQEAVSGPEAETEASVQDDERRLDVLNYRIEGNTVLTRMDVEGAVLPYLGPQRKVSDVEAARLALMKAYHAKGFETVDVRIPEQDVRGGIIRFEVVELKVGRLRVNDSRYFSPEDIKAQLPSLAEGGVPNYKNVASEIAGANKSADRMVTPTLRAGDTPGTVDVDINVEDKLPVHGSFEINDRASNRTKRARIAAGISYGNLFQMGHSLNLQAQVTPEKPEESWVVSASYVAPIRDTPWTIVGYGVHSDSDVSALGGINVLGSGDIFGLRGIYTKITGEAETARVHQITAGIDYKSFKEDLVLGSDTGKTPIDYIPLTVQYTQSQRTEDFDFDFSVGVNLGLRGLDATDNEFANKRYGAQANWVVLRSDIGYRHKFDNDWRAGAKVSMQYAGRPVISNEQFSAGGLDSVRAYYESQDLGDDGISVQFQVDTPYFHKKAGTWLNEARAFAFADDAALRIYEPLAGQHETTDLSSVGAGITLRALERLNASVLLAHPLTNRNSVIEDIDNNLRVQARIWSEF
jgi:hemolysin activation/secretion protein